MDEVRAARKDLDRDSAVEVQAGKGRRQRHHQSGAEGTHRHVEGLPDGRQQRGALSRSGVWPAGQQQAGAGNGGGCLAQQLASPKGVGEVVMTGQYRPPDSDRSASDRHHHPYECQNRSINFGGKYRIQLHWQSIQLRWQGTARSGAN
ncbi:hypothetical protein [Streptomyces sp. PanSC19]|uniref:hypothetical protein n=1 Tax=Streptomyces sp. PanSC19 TaxID=1520455 RepID=UPI0011CDEC8E|nr:hypothetical protein [Streptomyces sp. PanSC19]